MDGRVLGEFDNQGEGGNLGGGGGEGSWGGDRDSLGSFPFPFPELKGNTTTAIFQVFGCCCSSSPFPCVLVPHHWDL